MRNQLYSLPTTLVLASVLLGAMHPAFAQRTIIAPKADVGQMAIPEAIIGFDEQKVMADPICDSSQRPKIVTVEPDEVSPGDRIVITGHYFGKNKECLFGLSIGSQEGKDLKYISDQRLEVTVPESVSLGVIFLSIQSGGGAARSAILMKRAH